MSEVWVRSLDGVTLVRAKSITAITLGRGAREARVAIVSEGTTYEVASAAAESDVLRGVLEETILEVAEPIRYELVDRLTKLELDKDASHSFLSYQNGSWLSETAEREHTPA